MHAGRSYIFIRISGKTTRNAKVDNLSRDVRVEDSLRVVRPNMQMGMEEWLFIQIPRSGACIGTSSHSGQSELTTDRWGANSEDGKRNGSALPHWPHGDFGKWEELKCLIRMGWLRMSHLIENLDGGPTATSRARSGKTSPTTSLLGEVSNKMSTHFTAEGFGWVAPEGKRERLDSSNDAFNSAAAVLTLWNDHSPRLVRFKTSSRYSSHCSHNGM